MPLQSIPAENARHPGDRQVRPACRQFVARTLLVAATVLLVGCARGSDEPSVRLPVTDVILLRPRWAVAADLYVRLRSGPSGDAPIVGHLRRGEVAEITTIVSDAEAGGVGAGLWYDLAGPDVAGWARGDSLEFFASRTRAESAGRAISSAGNPP